jgi:hypothetical protein
MRRPPSGRWRKRRWPALPLNPQRGALLRGPPATPAAPCAPEDSALRAKGRGPPEAPPVRGVRSVEAEQQHKPTTTTTTQPPTTNHQPRHNPNQTPRNGPGPPALPSGLMPFARTATAPAPRRRRYLRSGPKRRFGLPPHGDPRRHPVESNAAACRGGPSLTEPRPPPPTAAATYAPGPLRLRPGVRTRTPLPRNPPPPETDQDHPQPPPIRRGLTSRNHDRTRGPSHHPLELEPDPHARHPARMLTEPSGTPPDGPPRAA